MNAYVDHDVAAANRIHTLFGQVMVYVAATTALFALGAYLGRNLGYGWAFVFYLLVDQPIWTPRPGSPRRYFSTPSTCSSSSYGYSPGAVTDDQSMQQRCRPIGFGRARPSAVPGNIPASRYALWVIWRCSGGQRPYAARAVDRTLNVGVKRGDSTSEWTSRQGVSECHPARRCGRRRPTPDVSP